MADTAAHLVDRVFPQVPVRQWVLSLPFRLRYRLGYDARLTGEVLRIFVRRLFASLKRRARRHLPIGDPKCGAVTFIQRFGGALNLNLHFHTLAIDGVFDPQAGMRFRPLPPPDDEEVERVARSVSRAIARLIEKRGLGRDSDPDESDPISRDEPLLAALYSASVRGRIATGPRAGQEVLRFGDRIDSDHLPGSRSPRCASVGGLSLHANVAVPARDRRRLERLCRYAGRPPFATERATRLPDGRILYELRHPWRDGTTHVAFEPLELLEKLAALVPPPRVHLVRYHGVFAPAARDRARVVPASAPAVQVAKTTDAEEREEPARSTPASSGTRPETRPRNYSWAELMRRVFEIDVLECPSCHGRMRILAAIHSPDAIRAILECLGLPARAPPVAPAEPESEADVWQEF